MTNLLATVTTIVVLSTNWSTIHQKTITNDCARCGRPLRLMIEKQAGGEITNTLATVVYDGATNVTLLKTEAGEEIFHRSVTNYFVTPNHRFFHSVMDGTNDPPANIMQQFWPAGAPTQFLNP